MKCEKGSARFQDVLASLVEVYVNLVLSLEFDIAGIEEFVEASKDF